MSEVQCPQCGAPITQDFGVVTCAACGTVLMVDFEGHLQRMDGAPAPDQTLHEAQPESEEYRDIFPNEQPEAVAEALVAPPEVGEVLAEIQEFANSDLTTTPMTYTVTIEGIDRGDLSRQIAEVLSDERFQIDTSGVMKKMKDGKIELQGLNAVKASVLVLRLRPLPLKISWRQYAYQS